MPEHQHIEYKEAWRDDYLRWICGFANAEGGTLVIGRNDRGQVVGVENAGKLLVDLPNKIRDVLGVMADVHLLHEAGKDLIEIHVEAYPSPISYKGEYHYRSGSTKQELKGAALTTFLLRKQGRTWDSVPVPYVTPRSLSKDALKEFRTLAKRSQRIDASVLRESVAGLLEKLDLLEGERLKRAAVLLFHPDPGRFCVGSYVKIGYFRSHSDLVYHDVIEGDLFTQARRTLELLMTKYLKAAISYQGIQRIETFPVPEPALREAVLNAIIHRDYGAGSPIQIRVYDDHLTIWNAGALPQNWSVETLLAPHSSRPFNPGVANAFFRAGQIEAWGRGIERIMETCRAERTPAPTIVGGADELRLDFMFAPEYLAIIAPKEKFPEDEDAAARTMEKTREKTREKLLQHLRTNPQASMVELADSLGLTRKGVEWQIRKLKQEGRILRTGPDKGGQWKVTS